MRAYPRGVVLEGFFGVKGCKLERLDEGRTGQFTPHRFGQIQGHAMFGELEVTTRYSRCSIRPNESWTEAKCALCSAAEATRRKPSTLDKGAYNVRAC